MLIFCVLGLACGHLNKTHSLVINNHVLSSFPQLLSCHQGQRVTEVQPFSSHVVSQTAADVAGKLTTEQAALLQAQKNMFKPHAVPKHVHESRPLEGIRVITTPKSPEQIFEVCPDPLSHPTHP
jgi:hypothetical protein